jgi:imidazolonepropionase-like amidohydrolase
MFSLRLALCSLLVLSGAKALRAETLLLTGATVHTVSGETLSPGQVLVKDGKIAAVGQNLSAAGAKTVDLKGLHLFPGLIAAPSTLGLVEINSVRATLDTTETGSFNPDVKAWLAVNPDSELLPVARANGITHFLATPMGGTVAGLSGLMTVSGWSTEDMTAKRPVALHVFWPSMTISSGAGGGRGGGGGGRGSRGGGGESGGNSQDEQVKARQQRLKDLDDFFEEARAYAKAREAAGKAGASSAPLNPAWEAVLPFLKGEVPLMVHANELRQIKAAANWADAQHFKIIIAGGRDAWQVADLLAAKKVPVIYDATWEQPAHDTDAYDTQFKAAEILHKAGVTVVISEGAGSRESAGSRSASSTRNLPYAAAQAVAFGLPEAQALKAITLTAAQVLGVGDRLGSIEPGKEATFFVCDGNILDIRSNVKRMWIAGKEVPLDSRHTRLYEKYKSRPRGEEVPR